MSPPGADKSRNITVNRRARHEYHIEDTYEAGLVLVGTEVKSLRAGRVNMVDSYGTIEGGEAWIKNLHISPWEKGNRFNHDPLRPRKLLLHRDEIRRLYVKTREKGLTLVPLRLYFSGGRVKVELGVGRGKKLHDKREAEAEKSARREMERVAGVAVKGRD